MIVRTALRSHVPVVMAVISLSTTPVWGQAAPANTTDLTAAITKAKAEATDSENGTGKVAPFSKDYQLARLRATNDNGTITYSTLIRNLVDQRIASRQLLKAATDASKLDPGKQPETPTLSDSSTSLTEKGSAGDFLSLALQLAGLASNGEKVDGGSASITAFALKALIDGHDPDGTDPTDLEYFRANEKYRRLSLTIGYDDPKSTSTNPKGTLLGVKWILKPRDQAIAKLLSTDEIKQLSQAFQEVGKADDKLVNALDDRLKLFDSAFTSNGDKANALNRLVTGPRNEEVTNAIDEVIADWLNTTGKTVNSNFDRLVAETAKKFRRTNQLTMNLQTKFLSGVPNDYKAVAIYEFGKDRKQKTNLIFNASYLRETDAGVTKKGMVISLEGQKLRGGSSQNTSTKSPQRLSFSGQIDTAAAKDILKGQFKWVIPLKTGIELPISITVANRTELITEGKVKGKIGFTFDLSKIGLAKP